MMCKRISPVRLFSLKQVLLGGLVSFSFSTVAQDIEISEVQRDLSIFAGILEDSLRLNESTGLFGMSLGGVEATYLYGQGAVFEVRSPLANRRNRMGLASLSSAMQALQLRQNPFEAVRMSTATAAPQTAAVAESAAPDESLYNQLLERVSNIDFSLVAQSSIQQASQSARALRALGDVDEDSFADLEAELESLRGAINENVAALQELERDIRAARTADNTSSGALASTAADQSVAAESSAASSTLSVQLDALLAAMEPVKARAVEKAQELRERSEQAEQEYAIAWQRDLELFREQLYQSLCEYGASLRTLPADEYVSVVLKGLGEDQPENRRTDEVHVVSYAQINSCSDGSTDAAALRQAATVYTY